MIEVSVADGKYRVLIDDDENGRMTAKRHGEEWRDVTGDNLIFNLAWELNELRESVQMRSVEGYE